MMNKNQKWVLGALALAAIFVATMFIKIPTPFGYFNLGEAMIFLFSSILPPMISSLAAGAASVLADLLGGYPQYALFTLIIKATEGFVVSWMVYKNHKDEVAAYSCGLMILVVGYLLTDWLLYGNLIVASGGILFNVAQGLCGLVVARLLVRRVKRINQV